ncbi:MAG: small ribosomal subunit Rsm22 family protein, partial [Actinomycetota bacterium]|nr:small ribosomal subunit Rsm22 family protein [Actinomycetota bacterium]
MVELPDQLRQALEAELDGYSTRQLWQAAERLSQRYRADESAREPIVSSPLDSAGYLTTRMPATYAAARQVFEGLATIRPDFRPRTLLDLGAGTGACTWAAADVFRSLESSHLVDNSTHALAAAERMLSSSPVQITRTAGRVDQPAGASAGQGFDLVVCGFLLGELEPATRDSVMSQMSSAASVVAVIDAGTPAGYRRILAARSALIAARHSVLAPCPHEEVCPLESTQDWCHFSVRLTRSIRHRQAKRAERGYEDEKYSYVVTSPQPPQRRLARILRHPQIRTGHVRMTLCDIEPGVREVTVSKRHG